MGSIVQHVCLQPSVCKPCDPSPVQTMAASASTSSWHRDKALASTRGLPALASTRGFGVATYNIGRSSQMQPKFKEQFPNDLTQLCTNASIICLQEVSCWWGRQVEKLVPKEWQVLREGALLTLWNQDVLHYRTQATLNVFPESRSADKEWCRCWAVGLQLDKTSDIISVINCHTLDCKDFHKITGNLECFTTAALQGSVAAAQRFCTDLATTQAPRQSRSFVVMGTFNMRRRDVVNVLRFMPLCQDNFACQGVTNDFVISNIHQEPMSLGPLAYNKQHTALQVHLELQEPRLPTQDTVFAPGSTWGKDTSGKAATDSIIAPGATRGTGATADEAIAREGAQHRAADILKSLYQIVAEHVKQEHEQEEEEQAEASQRGADDSEQAEANQRAAGRAKEEAASEAGLLVEVAVAPPFVAVVVSTAVVATTTNYHCHCYCYCCYYCYCCCHGPMPRDAVQKHSGSRNYGG